MKNGAGSYRRFLDGDESAFDDLLALYQENLIFFINRYVHNITVAEDLAADVFLDLIVHKHRYNFKTSLKTYLFMIGRSRALNYLKREGRCRTVEISEAGELIQEETVFEEQILKEEEKQVLLRAMRALPENYQTGLHLVYFENMSYEETARVMKKNLKQVKNLVYRAKKALRSILEGDKQGEK